MLCLSLLRTAHGGRAKTVWTGEFNFLYVIGHLLPRGRQIEDSNGGTAWSTITHQSLPCLDRLPLLGFPSQHRSVPGQRDDRGHLRSGAARGCSSSCRTARASCRCAPKRYQEASTCCATTCRVHGSGGEIRRATQVRNCTYERNNQNFRDAKIMFIFIFITFLSLRPCGLAGHARPRARGRDRRCSRSVCS